MEKEKSSDSANLQRNRNILQLSLKSNIILKSTSLFFLLLKLALSLKSLVMTICSWEIIIYYCKLWGQQYWGFPRKKRSLFRRLCLILCEVDYLLCWEKIASIAQSRLGRLHLSKTELLESVFSLHYLPYSFLSSLLTQKQNKYCVIHFGLFLLGFLFFLWVEIP